MPIDSDLKPLDDGVRVRTGAWISGSAALISAVMVVSMAGPVQAREQPIEPSFGVLLEDLPGPGELSAEEAESLALADEVRDEDVPQMPDGDYTSLLETDDEHAAGEALTEVDLPLKEPRSSVRDLEREVEGLPVVERTESTTTYEREGGSLIEVTSTDRLNISVGDG